jgi:hypothetical protein
LSISSIVAASTELYGTTTPPGFGDESTTMRVLCVRHSLPSLSLARNTALRVAVVSAWAKCMNEARGASRLDGIVGTGYHNQPVMERGGHACRVTN